MATDDRGRKPREEKKEEPKKSLIDSIDTAVSGYILRSARATLRSMVLEPLKKWSPKLWYSLAALYLKAPTTMRETFEGGLRTAAVVSENIIQALPFPYLFKRVMEDVLADAPNELANYFREQEKSIVFPEEYKEGLKVEDVQLLVTDFGRFFRQQMEKRFSWVAESIPLVAAFKGKPHQRFAKSLL